MIAAQSLPKLPTRPLDPAAAVVPAACRARAFHRLMGARARGTVSDRELLAATKAGDAGITRLLQDKAAKTPAPSIARIRPTDPKFNPSSHTLRGAAELLDALHQQGDVRDMDVRGWSKRNPRGILLHALARGLDRRANRLTRGIPMPRRRKSCFQPFRVIPHRLRAAILLQEADDGPAGCTLELVDTPFIGVRAETAESALAIDAALAALARTVPMAAGLLQGPRTSAEILAGPLLEFASDMECTLRLAKGNFKTVVQEHGEYCEDMFGYSIDDEGGRAWAQRMIADYRVLRWGKHWTPGSRGMRRWLESDEKLISPVRHLLALATHAAGHKWQKGTAPHQEESDECGEPLTLFLVDERRLDIDGVLHYYGSEGIDDRCLVDPDDRSVDAELKVFDRAVMELSYITSAAQGFLS